MKKTCAVSGVEFEVTEKDLKFYKKMGVPAPTLCPEERMRRRLTWRNERNFYQKKCDCCGKAMISTYLNCDAPIYCTKCWWSDKWDAVDSAAPFDFSRKFFPQFKLLVTSTPKPGIINDNETRSENSAYCQDTVSTKNCYLVVETGQSRDSMYSHNINRSVEVLDSYQAFDSELAYEIINSQRLYNCAFLQNCENCSDCFFGYDLKSCKNCFGCVNLRNKEYYFLNKPYSKEEYFKKLKEIKLNHHSVQSSIKESFKKFRQDHPHRFANFKNCEGCVGNNVFNCKDVIGYDVINTQYSKFVHTTDQVIHSYDAQGWKYSWCVETQTADECWEAKFCSWCESCKNIDYCLHCYSSHDLFACVGLRHKKYCILNKQYSKDEYFILRNKIIAHMKETEEWGEFFPINSSTFAYNETAAQEYFPMTKEEVLTKGWKWLDDDQKLHQKQTYVIPDDIENVPNSILKEILACECCGKNYKIQKAELKFYKKTRLPIPHKCPDCRHTDRMKLRNPRHLWARTCDKCGVDIQTTFAPDRPEKVYCEKCYLDCIE